MGLEDGAVANAGPRGTVATESDPDPPLTSASKGGEATREGPFQWETSKENLQPVKVGRSVEALKQATGLVSSDLGTAQEAARSFDEKRRWESRQRILRVTKCDEGFSSSPPFSCLT